MQELLEHAVWLRRLAQRLVGDESRADDLVQETWVAALQRPPRLEWNPVAWLRAVLRHRFGQSVREEARRRGRERRSARAEAQPSASEILAERAELQREIVEIVLGLPESYRDAVLLRYFEDLSPGQMARLQGIPVETVRTRIKRATEKLRRRLDEAHGGDRRAWQTAFLPLAGFGAPFVSRARLPRSGGASGSSATARSWALSCLASGGMTMASKKTSVGILLAVLLSLCVGGFFVWLSDERQKKADNALISATEPAKGRQPSATPVASPKSSRRNNTTQADEAAVALPIEASGSADTGRIHGRVHDARGEAIPGVPIEAARLISGGHWDEVIEVEGQTESDDGGEFSFDLLPLGTYRVRAISPSHRPEQESDVVVKKDKVVELEIELKEGLEIAGIVLDPYGHPVAGAEITSVRVGERHAVEALGLSDMERLWITERIKSITGEDGRFRLTRLPSRNRRIFASHPDWSTAEYDGIAAGSRDVQIRLRAGGAIAGRVVDRAGEPVAGARLEIALERQRFWHETLKTGGRAITDEHGEFSVETVPPGRFQLIVQADGYSRRVVENLEAIEGETLQDIEVVLSSGGAIRGVIVSSMGKPVAAASVVATPTTGQFWRREAETEADGTFVLSDLEVGAGYKLEAKHPDYVKGEMEPVAITEGELDIGSTSLEDGFVAEGRVETGNAVPVVAAEVRLGHLKGEHWMYGGTKAETDENGLFSFKALRPGKYQVVATAPGFAPESGLFEISDHDAADLHIVLGVGGRLSGRVVDDTGLPVPGAQVEVWKKHSSKAVAITDAEGRFVVRGVSEAPLKARAKLRDRASRTLGNLELGADVELLLERHGRVSGVVVDARTQERLREYHVYLSSEGRPSFGRGICFENPEGRFVITDVEPRKYVLRVRARGFVVHERPLKVTSGGDVVVTVALERGPGLEGFVVDDNGQPLSGARVRTLTPDEEEHGLRRPGGTYFARTADGMTEARGFDRERLDEVTTDERGRFVLLGLVPGNVKLRFEHEQFLPTTVENVPVPAEGLSPVASVRLDPGSGFDGSVLQEGGKPVHNGTVEIRRLGAEGEEDSGARRIYVPVGKDGRYRRTGLVPGRYRLEVVGRGGPERVVELGDHEMAREDFWLP